MPCCSRYPNRKGNEPKLIINNYYFVIGEVITTKSIDQKTTCLKWHDKRVVTMLSTFHNDEVIEKRRRTRRADEGTETVKKPKMVEDYNQHMGGVDRNDQLVKYYTYSHRLVLCKFVTNIVTCVHRSKKWWRRLFFHMLELALVNACILYNEKRNCRMPLLDFKLSVATHLLKNHQYRVDRRHHAPTTNLPLRLTERNTFPAKIEKNSQFGGRPLCEVCRARGQRSQTQFCCKTCKTPLHPYPCMEIYHTKLDYHKL